MSVPSENPWLGGISTLWSLVYRANQASGDVANLARLQLLARYGGAVRRYLSKLLGDPDAVDEVFQEFSLQLVHGALRGADPQRGRFRNFVKGTLFHLIADYRKQRWKWPQPLPADHAALAADPEEMESDRQFLEDWRDELLARAWVALADIDATTGQPFYVVLRFRADHPQMRSPQMAQQLSVQLGKRLTASGVRQILHRAREKFAGLLLDEVRHSLANPTTDEVEEELVDLGLLEYCRPALGRSPTPRPRQQKRQ
jgi:RNA polymerase sigma-70 factor (ECF subfamily)